jgi:hypothetical protein
MTQTAATAERVAPAQKLPPPRFGEQKPSAFADLDKSLKTLDDAKGRWAKLGLPERADLLRRCMDTLLAGAEDQVLDACKAKGLDPNTPQAAEEWLGGPMTTMRNLRLLHEAIEEIRATGRPVLPPNAVSTRPDGQVVVQIFPKAFLDKLAYMGFKAEIWMDPELDASEVSQTMATIYQPGADVPGKVALVLGAGNVASIGPMDVLYKLFVENQVCILKMNPVNEYLGPHIERGLAPLVEAGYLRVAYGGAEVGEYLVHHDVVEEIHITGSDVIHDIIVWGSPGEEQEANKRAGTPKMNKRITSELGCVTPIVIVPGEWSDKELAFQAANVATMVANNASFNCNAAKLLITSASWPQRDRFLSLLEETLRTVPTRKAYYPGSDRKYDAFMAAHPEAKQLAPRTPDVLPWTTIFRVDSDSDDMVFTREAWCAIIAETGLKANGPVDFLEKATAFCNDRMWGTLSCSVIIDPRTQKSHAAALDKAVAELRYGSVAVNHWAALSYGLVATTWGAYPEHTLDEVVSGIGVVHNTFMFEKPQKSVVWGPFTMSPKPPWFSTHKNAHVVAKKLVAFEHKPTLWKFLGIAMAAMKG